MSRHKNIKNFAAEAIFDDEDYYNDDDDGYGQEI